MMQDLFVGGKNGLFPQIRCSKGYKT